MRDLVIINGQINTMALGAAEAQAIAIKDGRIIKVGTNEEIRRAMPLGADVIDAEGNSVFPGFFDTHVHFTMTGQNLSAVQLYGVSSGEELMRRLEEGAVHLGAGEWLRGVGYDERQYEPGDFPTLELLDRAFCNRPVFLSRIDEHQIFLNSIAMKEMEVVPGEEGVELDEDGKPTGIIKDPSNGKVRDAFINRHVDDEMFRKFYEAAAHEALKHGTTTVCCLEGGEICGEKSASAFLNYQGAIPLNTHLFHQTMDVKKVLTEGQRSIGGCIVLDGSLGSHTAALFEDYADLEGCKGSLYYTPEEVEDFIMEAHMNGLQASMHCIGDRAIETLLRA
ncbi:MAG: amidohydrolase family protein, partial [Firmicutes bacterium]|nr:amidohydrolase family protein [Bacillota bacterium]